MLYCSDSLEHFRVRVCVFVSVYVWVCVHVCVCGRLLQVFGAVPFRFLIASASPCDPQVVSFILIGVGTYCKDAAIVANISIISGMIGCGVVLFFLSLLGFVASRKHNQVLLFFVSF